MKREEFAALRLGQVIYHAFVKNADGSRLRVRVSGKFRAFRNGWYIPVEYGLRTSFWIGEGPRTGRVSREYGNPANWLPEDN